ncbi:hypothetical protein MRS44_004639 [Fusarium solani]|uniref:uncharacterized protein n=1 Tax=Fusarium solani TaxID=169388 RepID=UPI0032C43FDE|nr:hypothetical protein MRS44_004639 [Fusarium solani]
MKPPQAAPSGSTGAQRVRGESCASSCSSPPHSDLFATSELPLRILPAQTPPAALHKSLAPRLPLPRSSVRLRKPARDPAPAPGHLHVARPQRRAGSDGYLSQFHCLFAVHCSQGLVEVRVQSPCASGGLATSSKRRRIRQKKRMLTAESNPDPAEKPPHRPLLKVREPSSTSSREYRLAIDPDITNQRASLGFFVPGLLQPSSSGDKAPSRFGRSLEF